MRNFRKGVHVSGTASISLKPDVARVVLGVEALDDTVAEASGQATDIRTRSGYPE